MDIILKVFITIVIGSFAVLISALAIQEVMDVYRSFKGGQE